MKRFFFLLFLIQFSSVIFTQSVSAGHTNAESDIDTNYIQKFPGFITTRFYLSRKYTNMGLFDENNDVSLIYEPNTTLNLGIGATVRGFTLNLAYGFKFLNQDKGQGKTRYLDLQSHLYTGKYIIDVFGQFYNGLFLENTIELNPESEKPYYVRPDLHLRLFGVNFLRVLNNRKFSYAAPFVHNEYQKKSAGSFLFGGDVTLLFAKGDSSFIPSFMNDTLFSAFDGISNITSLQFGPSVGYGYSLVIRKHFFLTLALNLSFIVSISEFEYEPYSKEQDWQFNPNYAARIAFGYNSPKWYLALQWVQNTSGLTSVDESISGVFGVGNVRLNYVRRFKMGPKLVQQIDRIPLLKSMGE